MVAGIDRAFPLAWVVFYFLLPTSGWAATMLRTWHDQRLYLTALTETLSTGHSAAVSDNIVGPAYIAVARGLHDVLRLSPENSLVILSRGSYVASVALGMLLVRASLRRLCDAPPMVTLCSQLAFAALAFAAGTWHWSDVPWTHFFAAALAVGIFAARFGWRTEMPGRGAVIGALLALLLLTRTFELAALVAAWLITLLVMVIVGRPIAHRIRLAGAIAGGAAFFIVFAAVYAATGKRGIFVLYGSNLDQLSANVDASEIASTPTFSFGLLPTKLVQLFIEPCFDALCSIADYQHPLNQLVPSQIASAGNYRLWSLPLIVQLPALILLPVCLVGCAAFLVRARRRPRAMQIDALRLPLEMSIAATGLVVGYTSNTLSGSPHLRYGLARDFLLPALLAGIVGTVFVSWAVWRALRALDRRPFVTEAAFAGACLLVAALAVSATAYARSHGIPRLTGRQLADVTYTASCTDAACRIAVAATSPRHTRVSIPDSSTLTFQCSAGRGFTIYVPRLDQPVALGRRCRDARLVAAWPTVMGLPPGTFELGAVSVSNT